MTTLIDCPNHNGNYDCTPFCSVCEGNQVYEPKQSSPKKVAPNLTELEALDIMAGVLGVLRNDQTK